MTAIETTASPMPLFLLSFRQRDELAMIAARAGWRIVAARRAEDVERRFRASGAALAVIDARGAADAALAAATTLGAARGGPAAMLICLSRADAGQLGGFYAAGATHFLVSPITEEVFAHGLRFAARATVGEEPRASAGIEMIGWRHDPVRGRVQLSPALAGLLDMAEGQPPAALLRRLAREDRRAVGNALRRLRDGEAATAVAHVLPGLGRVVQHLQYDAATGRVHALIEPLGEPPDIGAVLRDAMPAVRDEQGARLWIDHALRAGTPVSAAILSLARFDTINRAYGSAAGDRLLALAMRRIGEAAGGVLGRRAIVTRLAGATFLVATREPQAALAEAIVAVEAALARPYVVGGELVMLGVTAASATSVPGDDAARLLLRVGASAGIVAGGAAQDARVEQLAVDLRRALGAGEIEIVYQPQVAISGGAIVGVEALARWRHPALGPLGAELLFAAAARAGLTTSLSEHIQQCALAGAARWPAALGGLRLAINVTAEDVARANFTDALLDRVDASGFPRARLTVEVTESGLIAELGEAARLLAELRRAGCRVAIDDFGTGYSSLAYLKALPLDYLKIDRTLTQDIAGSPRDRIVVRGVIDMARSLGLAVVAEGVETAEQLDLLASEGCQFYQGFLCAPPLDVTALTELVERN